MATVLVVDDEFGLVEVITVALEDEGHRVIVAVHGRQGLERLAEGSVDLVLLDFMMPLLDGPGMVRAMQADPAMREIPVVVMTSLDEARVRQACGDSVEYLRKPFSIGRISQVVERRLGERGRGSSTGGGAGC